MFMVVGIEKECKVIKEFHWKKSLFALFGEKVSYLFSYSHTT